MHAQRAIRGYPAAGSGPGEDGSRQTPVSPPTRVSAASHDGFMALHTAFTELFSVRYPIADLAAPTPVPAAGGIADGRGVAAALALGAAGALLGTRFLAACEALVTPGVTKAIIEGGGEDTDRSRVSDIARGAPWPSRYPARTLRNPFFDRWRGREDELAADPAARQAYREAVARGTLPREPVWASEAIDLITGVSPAADRVGALAAQAGQALVKASNQ